MLIEQPCKLADGLYLLGGKQSLPVSRSSHRLR